MDRWRRVERPAFLLHHRSHRVICALRLGRLLIPSTAPVTLQPVPAIALVVGVVLVPNTLWDVFETIVLRLVNTTDWLPATLDCIYEVLDSDDTRQPMFVEPDRIEAGAILLAGVALEAS